MQQLGTADGGARASDSLNTTERTGTGGSVASVRWLQHRRRVDGQPWVRTPPGPYLRKRHPVIPGRDRFWRRDAHIAIDEALRAGELALHEASLLRAVLAHSNDAGEVVWAGQAAIAQAAGWSSERTARRWLRAAEARGWVAVEHRCERRPDGTVRALTNLTVVTLPPEVEARRMARKGAGKGHATPRAPQNRAHRERGESRPVPPMVTPADATAVVLPERPEPPTTGPGAVLAARVLRMARHGP